MPPCCFGFGPITPPIRNGAVEDGPPAIGLDLRNELHRSDASRLGGTDRHPRSFELVLGNARPLCGSLRDPLKQAIFEPADLLRFHDSFLPVLAWTRSARIMLHGPPRASPARRTTIARARRKALGIQ